MPPNIIAPIAKPTSVIPARAIDNQFRQTTFVMQTQTEQVQ